MGSQTLPSQPKAGADGVTAPCCLGAVNAEAGAAQGKPVPDPALPQASPTATPNDERLEKREAELEFQRNALGESIASARCFTAHLSRLTQRRRATHQEELAYLLGRLAEVREVRRALLGLRHNTHIRGRALPNFVADNPGYAKVVGDEVPEAKRVAESYERGDSSHE